ncbi:MAG: bifunctional pyr operon transcriptional regulator/uracil phosphoribosyltransferase PyrR [Myxococcota bacterium]|jgi:pyrimidine operon attenuation protein/uracil phosphoribosyltransferase|nr:bifunctional pyr operon transcriptional regulator/uracil phosphoribosyltransferase PyrR [Myxococcota bacterium]
MASQHPSQPGNRVTTGGARDERAKGAVNGGNAEEVVVLDDTAIQRSLTRIAHEVVERHDDLSRLYLVAIPNGGVPLGRILQSKLAAIGDAEVPLGILDTTLYRDDLSRGGVRPPLRRTEMPSSVDERIVLIVEDVVSTGRTIRAAMDAMIDFGRPTSVQVVALVDRGHRELPIKIDYVGKNIPTQVGDKVKFRSKGTTPSGELEAPFEVVVTGGGAPRASRSGERGEGGR